MELNAHWWKHRVWIDSFFRKKKAAWVVACGERIVAWSGDMLEFPRESDLIKMGEETDLVPFAYTAPMPIEESTLAGESTPWAATNYPGDAYPTIAVEIEGVSVEDDFDTGALQTMVSDEVVKKKFLDRWRGHSTLHLGESYEWFSRMVDVIVVCEDGTRIETSLPVAVVKEWSVSPFVRVNGSRKILVGRDLLRAVPNIEIILDSMCKTTRVRRKADA